MALSHEDRAELDDRQEENGPDQHIRDRRDPRLADKRGMHVLIQLEVPRHRGLDLLSLTLEHVALPCWLRDDCQKDGVWRMLTKWCEDRFEGLTPS